MVYVVFFVFIFDIKCVYDFYFVVFYYDFMGEIMFNIFFFGGNVNLLEFCEEYVKGIFVWWY